MKAFRVGSAAVLAGFLLTLAAPPTPAHSAIYIVRHAEKRDPKDPKSLLSGKGKKRADDLKRVLSSVELKAVYVTEFERTRQTAVPTAVAQGLKPKTINSEDLDGLIAALKALPENEDVLVVGHTDTIPDLLKKLGVARPVKLEADDYDNLFIVTLQKDKPAAFSWLHFQ